MNPLRALGALTLSTTVLLTALAPAAQARPADVDPPGATPRAAAVREYDGRWISPGERYLVAGEPRTVVRLRKHAVVVRLGGTRLRARLPSGWEPRMPAIAIPLGQAGAGFLVRQEGGDSTGWTLLLVRDGALVAATEPARPSFDGGFRADGTHTRTWVTPRGRLRSERTGGGRVRRVWSWEVAGPGEGGSTEPGAPAWGDLVATRVR